VYVAIRNRLFVGISRNFRDVRTDSGSGAGNSG
jgi:hypothetical protein